MKIPPKSENNHLLVPVPDGLLANAAAGAKRIMSAMIGETLDVVRRGAHEAEAIFQQGLDEGKDGARGLAFDHYKRAAEMGHLGAQYKLGRCYLLWDGPDSDKESGTGAWTDAWHKHCEVEGVAWLTRALDSGYARAGFALGLYFQTLSLPNLPEAFKYYKRAVELGCEHSTAKLAEVQTRLNEASKTAAVQSAAEGGCSDACYEMGMRCLEGIGISQSWDEAFVWFHKAGELGNAKAQSRLAEYYRDDQDLEQGLYWCRKSARQGNVSDQSSLGEFYSSGWGAVCWEGNSDRKGWVWKRNQEQAVFWFRKAAPGSRPARP